MEEENEPTKKKRLFNFLRYYFDFMMKVFLKAGILVVVLTPIYVFSGIYLLYYVFSLSPSSKFFERELLFNFQETPPSTRAIELSNEEILPQVYFEEIRIKLGLNTYVSKFDSFMVFLDFLDEKGDVLESIFHPCYDQKQESSWTYWILSRALLYGFFTGGRNPNELNELQMLGNRKHKDSREFERLNRIIKESTFFKVRLSSNNIPLDPSKSVIQFFSTISGWRYWMFHYPALSFFVLAPVLWGIITAILFLIGAMGVVFCCVGRFKKVFRKTKNE